MSPEGGGVAEGVTRQAQIAHSAGIYETEIVCLDDPSRAYFESDDFLVHAVGPGLGKYGYTPRLDKWLKANLGRFDGVVINGLWQYHAWAASRACRGGVPYLVFTHGMLDPWFQRRYPLKHFKKVLYWKAVEEGVLRHAKAVLFTSALEAELAKQSFSPSEWTSAVVPFGTIAPGGDRDTPIQEFYAACPHARGRKFVLFLGRLHEKKGCDLLIAAFARCFGGDSSLHLVMAGPDQQGCKAKLMSIAADAGIADRVHFPGMLQGGAKWGAFYAAEAFALPSHQENFGIAVAEALACGTPVLISNQVNIWQEIVEDGVGLAEEDTVEGTCQLLNRWESLSTSAKVEMGARCRATFERRFDIQRLPKVIAEVLRRTQPPAGRV